MIRKAMGGLGAFRALTAYRCVRVCMCAHTREISSQSTHNLPLSCNSAISEREDIARNGKIASRVGGFAFGVGPAAPIAFRRTCHRCGSTMGGTTSPIARVAVAGGAAFDRCGMALGALASVVDRADALEGLGSSQGGHPPAGRPARENSAVMLAETEVAGVSPVAALVAAGGAGAGRWKTA